ncbi:MAG: transcriptional regulator [Cyanobacteria bacterium CRU_2_1]|nr:transcriptional regulator [Cyanobacteria bacterium CRU_2_1]
MTIGSKTPSSYYMELINSFPPRPITNEAELLATQAQIHSILDKGNLTQDDRDYLKVLGILVYDYEDKYEPMPSLGVGELLKALMEESELELNDLLPIFETEAIVLAVLNNERKLTDRQINELAARFHIPPNLFR